jgi:hypothetical protein
MVGTLGPGIGVGKAARFMYVATAGQVTFSGADSSAQALTLQYTPGFIEVVLNGVWLPPTDYTATNGSSVVLPNACVAGDVVYAYVLSAVALIANRPTIQLLTSGTAATYTTPVGCTWIEVFMVAAGGGGAGIGTATNGSVVAGADGSKTIFNSIETNPGKGGGVNGTTAVTSYIGGLGGRAGTGTANRRFPGQQGGSTQSANATSGTPSGQGGGTIYGGFGAGGSVSATSVAGISADANTGGGGGGASGTGTNFVNGPGGGGGESAYLLILSPAATYTYTIGPGGAGGVGTTVTGGAGGSGHAMVVEHYGT